jgi:hypothetical protein
MGVPTATLIPGPFGTIEQDDIGRAFVAEFISSSTPNGIVYLDNQAMRTAYCILCACSAFSGTGLTVPRSFDRSSSAT